jgi:hypothetical protein
VGFRDSIRATGWAFDLFFASDGGAGVAEGLQPDEAGDVVFFCEARDAGVEVAGYAGVEDAGFSAENVDMGDAVHAGDCDMGLVEGQRFIARDAKPRSASLHGPTRSIRRGRRSNVKRKSVGLFCSAMTRSERREQRPCRKMLGRMQCLLDGDAKSRVRLSRPLAILRRGPVAQRRMGCWNIRCRIVCNKGDFTCQFSLGFFLD